MPKEAYFQLFRADAVEWLRRLPDECVDLVVTDPPYESLEKHRAVGTTTRLSQSKSSSNQWFEIFPNSRFEELFVEVMRVLKQDRHFYLFCDAETMFVVKPLAEKVGFKFWKPLIWDKRRIGMGYHYRARYECILFFEKGKRRLNDLGIADVLEVPRVSTGYPTEKPVPLLETLITQSTEEGELVADPFMGSASAGVAAALTDRGFVGSDLSQGSVNLAFERMTSTGAVKSDDIIADFNKGNQLSLFSLLPYLELEGISMETDAESSWLAGKDDPAGEALSPEHLV